MTGTGRQRHRRAVEPYVYLVPVLVLSALFFAYPLALSVGMSFSDWNLINDSKRFVGLANYRAIFVDPVFWRSIENTLAYALVTVPLSVGLGLLYGLLIEQTGKFRGFYRFIFFLPVVVSVAASGLSFSLIFSPVGGMLDLAVRSIGLRVHNWLQEPRTALAAVMAVGVWHSFGYNVVLYIAGLKQIDATLYRAAEVDGATDRHKLVHITLPLLSPVHLFAVVITLIFSFQVFSTVQIMTMGGPDNASNVLVFYIWMQAFQFDRLGPATAAGAMLLLFVGLLTVSAVRVLQERIHYQ